MHDVIVVGLGFASQTHWLPALRTHEDRLRVVGAVDSLEEQRKKAVRIFPDIWTAPSVDAMPDEVSRDAIVFVVTPDHFQVILALVAMGFKNLAIEKPLVSRDKELPLFEALECKDDLRVYAIDHYFAKIFPFGVVNGVVSLGDPRLSMLQINGDHRLEELSGCLGHTTGVCYMNVEAGELAIPYLNTHPWLEHDREIGGMIRDLGPHAFAPLVDVGLMTHNVKVWDIALSKLSADRSELEPVRRRNEVEMHISTMLCDPNDDFPLMVTFGKVPRAAGVRTLVVQGEKGSYFLDLPRNRSAVLMTRDGRVSRLSLRVPTNDFVVKEIALFYEDAIPEVEENSFDGHLVASKIALRTGILVRKAYFDSIRK